MAITQTTDVTWDQSAYDRAAYFPFREQQHFDGFATVKPTAQAMPGSAVIFDKITDLAAATTALTQDTDVTPATMGDSQVTVTLAEYGNAVSKTARLTAVSYLPLDPIMANLIGFNAGISIDGVARAVAIAGTNVVFGGTAANQAALVAGDVLTAAKVRYLRNRLRRGKVPKIGNAYVAHVHPDCLYDLRAETGSGSWRSPHEYVDVNGVYSDEMGMFEGFRFVEDADATITADGGAANVDAYLNLFFGMDFLAKAYSIAPGFGPNPRTVVSPVVDKLRRFTGMGWYHVVGYGIFRQESIYRLECASSVGANT